MKFDRAKVYILEISFIIVLSFLLWFKIDRRIIALIIFLYSCLTHVMIKNKKNKSIYSKEFILLMLLFSIIYLGVFYLLGIFTGYVKSKFIFSLWTIRNYILPFSLIIIFSEIIRYKLITQSVKISIKGHKINISQVFIFIFMVLIDLVLYEDVYSSNGLNEFLITLGFVLFASFSTNLLYNYSSYRFGCLGIIIYKLVTTLFIYFIPVTSNIYILFRIFLRILYPYIIYVILEKTYGVSRKLSYQERKNNIVYNTFLLLLSVLIIMLVSCEFLYGMLVIGSRSMKGSIDVGDIVFFKDYRNDDINIGDVIIFDKGDMQIVHRVVDTKNVDGQWRYYTKGDANKEMDLGYVTTPMINGIVKFKIKHLGYPTIWIRKMFK